MNQQPTSPKPQLLIFWVLWFAFQAGIVMIYTFLAKPNPPAPDASMVWVGLVIPVLISAVLRWNVLPRITDAQMALTLMIAGVAFAEGTCFFGIFLMPAHQQELFVFSVLGIAQWVPLWARRYFTTP